MAKDPAFLFYPGDWNLGTMHLTLLEKGCYMELLMLQFTKDKFTLANAKHMLRDSFDLAWANIKDKFEFDGKFYYNKRLKEEKEKRQKFTESRRSNGLIDKKDIKSLKANAKHMLKHMEDENENKDVIIIKDIIYPTFENFWSDYDKKIGQREKIETKWLKLSQKDKEDIMDYIPFYKNSQPNKIYRKNPETFLNNKGWKDEIINSDNKITNGQFTTDRAKKSEGLDSLVKLARNVLESRSQNNNGSY